MKLTAPRPFRKWTRSRKIQEIKIFLDRREEKVLFYLPDTLVLFGVPALAFSLFLIRKREEKWGRVEVHSSENLTT